MSVGVMAALLYLTGGEGAAAGGLWRWGSTMRAGWQHCTNWRHVWPVHCTLLVQGLPA
jgi:hypothetical protein